MQSRLSAYLKGMLIHAPGMKMIVCVCVCACVLRVKFSHFKVASYTVSSAKGRLVKDRIALKEEPDSVAHCVLEMLH